MNTTEDSSQYKVDDTARFVFIFIGSLEVVSGVAGNCLLLTVLLTRVRSMGMRSSHHYFIANLALSDLVTLGYWLPFFVLDLILNEHPVENDNHCKANGFIIAVCLATGVFSLTCISLNRYLHVCHNHLYRRVFTKARTIACCVCLWVFSSLVALPPLVNVGAYEYSQTSHICSFQSGQPDSDDVYPKAMIVIFTVVPMCVVGYLNYGIFRYWKMARLKLSTKYSLIRTAQVTREEVLEIVTDNRKTGTDTVDSEIQSEQNVVETVGIKQSEMSMRVGTDQSETSTSNSQDESGAFDEEASVSDSQALEQQQDTQPVDIQPACPLDNQDADNVIHKKILQLHSANSDVRKVVKSDENNDDSQISMLEENPGQLQSQQCSSSQRREPTLDTKQGLKEEVDMICSEGRRLPQLVIAQARSTPARGPSLTGCKRLSRRRRKQLAREMAFVRSLCVVFFLMLFCLFPFGVSMIVDSFNTLPINVEMTCNLILFFNSSVNWIVYGVMNRSFSRDYVTHVRRVMRMCWPRLCARLPEELVNTDKSTIRSRFAQ